MNDLGSTKVSLANLQRYLNNIRCPSPNSDGHTSILRICGIERNENAWSDIYAYFPNPNADHDLGTLFLDTLLSLVDKSIKRNFGITDIRIVREYKTEKGNRIDILIMTPQVVVIIENKIYHSVVNPFDDYWDAVNAVNKIGILLT